MGEFGPRRVFPPKCVSTEHSVSMGILLLSRYHLSSTTSCSMRPSLARGTCQRQEMGPLGKGKRGKLQGLVAAREDASSYRTFRARGGIYWLPWSAAASLPPSLAPHSRHSWASGSSRAGLRGENLASYNFPGLQLKPASPFYRKERKNQSAKEKVKYGWSTEEAPSEISGCFSSELSMQQVLEKSLLENTFTKQQKANLRFEFHGLGKKGNTQSNIPGSKLAALQNRDRGILKLAEVYWKSWKKN